MNLSCYLCKKKSPQKIFTKLGYDFRKCPHCNLTTLRFDRDYQNFIKHYYNKKFFTGSSDRVGYVDYQEDSWPEKINMHRYLHRIKRFVKTGTILDCGCATGLFLDIAKLHGFETYGFDVSSWAIKHAKKSHGHRVQQATFDTADFNRKKFDVVTLFDVIEHLKDPRGDLLKITKHLKQDGLLLINTGDSDSFLARFQGKNWHYYIPPQHLFFFSQKTLTLLLDQIGFQVIKIDYKGKWLSVRYLLNLAQHIHQNPIAKFFYPHINNNLFGKIPLYLNLFDNMVIYAKKK